MTKILIRSTAIIFSILLAAYLLISGVMYIGLNPEIYKQAQIEYEISEYAGLDQQTLDDATRMLIDYMEGRRDDINMTGKVNNIDVQLFNSKEKMHMADVRILFNMGKTTLKVSLSVMILILLFLMTWNYKDFANYFFRACMISLGVILCFIVVVSSIAVMNFTLFWELFHKVLFTNDLYLLNPASDLLIRIMPERFFISLSLKVIYRFMSSYLISIVLLFIANKTLKRKRG